jgi:hypothetical protein
LLASTDRARLRYRAHANRLIRDALDLVDRATQAVASALSEREHGDDALVRAREAVRRARAALGLVRLEF